MTFSYNATKGENVIISGKETFDLRSIRKTYAMPNYKIVKTINNFNIDVEIDITAGTLTFNGNLLYGTIYTHDI